LCDDSDDDDGDGEGGGTANRSNLFGMPGPGGIGGAGGNHHQEYMFFKTDAYVGDLLDAKDFPPIERTEFTATGRMRKGKKSKERTGKVVEVNGMKLAIFRYGIDLYAIQTKCPHQVRARAGRRGVEGPSLGLVSK
jgi:hypothetical protein